MERVATVERLKGSPARAAARATASSPSGSAMRAKPVGASTSGNGSRRPSRVTPVSTCDTSASTRGAKFQRRKASLLARSVTSSSAPPSM